LVYSIEPAGAVNALRDLLHASHLFAHADMHRVDVPPHMTIAEFITVEESVALEGALDGHAREGSWLCDDLVYAVPDDTFTFRAVITLPLG
jgi:hypothetical protein